MVPTLACNNKYFPYTNLSFLCAPNLNDLPNTNKKYFPYTNLKDRGGPKYKLVGANIYKKCATIYKKCVNVKLQ
jgi:hypothetical protein